MRERLLNWLLDTLSWLIDWYGDGAEAREEFRVAWLDFRYEACKSLGVYRLLDWLAQRGD